MERLVSILIPAYNAERWIGDTIKSALEQTWQNKEIIIVDDGSSDQTLSIAQQFSSKNVCIVSQANRGAATARNRALSMSQGDYIQWLDADDLLAPSKISRQMAASESYSKRILLSCPWGRFIYRPHRARFVPTSVWSDLEPVEWMLRYFERNDWLQTGTWLVSHELTEAAGPWDTRLSFDDDGEYFTRVMLASDGIRFIKEAKVFYRRGIDTLSYVGLSKRKLDSQFFSMQLRINHLLKVEDSERVRVACLKYLQRSMICFYPERPEIVKQIEQLGRNLGGQIEPPRLPWKYAGIQKVLGWNGAKRFQLYYNRIKSSLIRGLDHILLHLNI